MGELEHLERLFHDNVEQQRKMEKRQYVTGLVGMGLGLTFVVYWLTGIISTLVIL
ncbi:hypothetical protein AALB53_09035 [Lachnospiraceae bacterium 47-T17]